MAINNQLKKILAKADKQWITSFFEIPDDIEKIRKFRLYYILNNDPELKKIYLGRDDNKIYFQFPDQAGIDEFNSKLEQALNNLGYITGYGE